MIKCPHCAGDISEIVTICRHCNRSITSGEILLVPKAPKTSGHMVRRTVNIRGIKSTLDIKVNKWLAANKATLISVTISNDTLYGNNGWATASVVYEVEVKSPLGNSVAGTQGCAIVTIVIPLLILFTIYSRIS
jgi:hypothetical protein